ncbi:MAG: phage shock protein operon transcriptional activator [Hyphomicrobiales bacterium]|nr:phage shock protein operon transcriptional activator [Hyphomicrobiales bacterium]MCP5371900.1 phage shock protein operon transcriptional activator [Hyphomicrobiales bacterium]
MSTTELPPLIGQSPAFLALLEEVSRLAPLARPVLLAGERGTGKELIAQRLHFLSARWDRAFVQVNCAALAETLLESELFGHEAGAFTGAVRRRAGRFERAHGGSLFLDEIASASLSAQEKVLRIIEYGEMERLGGDAVLRVDVRVIAAANVDLPAAADAGAFRHDLLDRLAFDVLTLPPLRHRAGDIPLLAETFGRAMAVELEWDAWPGFSRRALATLQDHAWPGNVRELKNAVERAVYRWGDPQAPVDEVRVDPFASPHRPPAPRPRAPAAGAPPPAGATEIPDAGRPLDLDGALADLERRLLHQALAANRFHQRATADHLGLTYHQLRNRLRKYNLLHQDG